MEEHEHYEIMGVCIDDFVSGSDLVDEYDKKDEDLAKSLTGDEWLLVRDTMENYLWDGDAFDEAKALALDKVREFRREQSETK